MITNLLHNDAMYVIAIEHGDYRAATIFALREVRRAPAVELWRTRLWGAFRRRHRERAST